MAVRSRGKEAGPPVPGAEPTPTAPPRGEAAGISLSRGVSAEKADWLYKADRLVTLAKCRSLPGTIKLRLARTLLVHPELAVELAARQTAVPKRPARSPWVTALRRIAWPSEKLAARHRRVLSEARAGRGGFLELALEEARTWSWRNADRETLGAFAVWLRSLPSEFGGNALVARAFVYDALWVVGFGRTGAAPEEIDEHLQLLQKSLKPLLAKWIPD